MNSSWAITAAVLMLGLALQTYRVYDRTVDLTIEREKIASLELQVRTFKRAVLTDVGAAVDDEQFLPKHGIYMLVDTRCGACASAVAQLSDGDLSQTLRVASFVDPPEMVEAWLSDLGAVFEVVDVPTESTFLAKLPRHVTPLYLEFQGQRPVDIHVGPPPSEWLGAVGERTQP